MRYPLLTALCIALAAGACTTPEPEPRIDLEAVPLDPAPATLHRLSQQQYRNSIRDLFGADIVIPSALEPDVSVDGLIALGGANATISPLGVERYESAALKVASQAVATPARRAALIPCKPKETADAACFEQVITTLGRRVWRRPLATEEIDSLVGVATAAAQQFSSFMRGVEFAVAALLQSPNFLFRVELGEPDPEHPGALRYTGYEMASRLAFFLTNTTPDDELLAAAESGALGGDAGVREQARRLLETPGAREAVRNFFTELYELYELDHLMKDTMVHTFMDKELGPAAREETLRLIEDIVFEQDADFRTFFTSQRTFVDRRLAALYGIPAPVTDGFGAVTLPRTLGRRGFLGHASFLANQSHPVDSSAVLRGKFVRVVLLCGEIPPPPSELNTGIPEPSDDAPTLRERSTIHQQDPNCAACHRNMDPIGLGLENFDALGKWRTHDNGALIDASGDLDGARFGSAWDLGGAIASHPQVGYCLARNLLRYATGHVEEYGQFEFLIALGKAFEQSGFRIRNLLVDVAASRAFRHAGMVSE